MLRFCFAPVMLTLLLSQAPQAQTPPPAEPAPAPLAARIGDVPVQLSAPPAHCFLDEAQAADKRVVDEFFRPRQGKLNTFLGAFIECRQLGEMRAKRNVRPSSFGYLLYVTQAAGKTVTLPTAQFVRDNCQATRGRSGSLDLAAHPSAAHTQIEAFMQALQANGPPHFGEVVVQDNNGCYQMILSKSVVNGIEHRDILLTTVTLLKGRIVIYTRSLAYVNARTIDFLAKWVPFELAALMKANP